MISSSEKKNLKIGYKQTIKALSKKCAKVFIAEDCEDRIKDAVKKAAQEIGSDVYYIATMQELGKMCEISRGASCAVIAND